MKYGKIYTTESYEDGQVARLKQEVEQSVEVRDRHEALAIFTECLNKIDAKQSYKIGIELFANPYTFKLKRGVKKWQIENKRFDPDSNKPPKEADGE